uniref:RING-type domain-containing protein n=1 Tax=Macaca mulatta TaxID=9544 RepID=A0A5F7ZAM3_MACMU
MTILASVLKVSHSVAKLILVNFYWQVSEILDRFPHPIPLTTVQCVCSLCERKTYSLWPVSTSFAAAAGSSTAQFSSRMAWAWESLIWLRTVHSIHQRTLFPLLPNEELRKKYRRYLFRDYVESHYQLQLCPGADCPMVIWVQEPRACRVQCNRCNEVFCFKCHQMYHAPTDTPQSGNGSQSVQTTLKQPTTLVPTLKTVPSATSALRRMEAAITCTAPNVNMTSAGCV